ncbi:hypothetical protein [Candidatus Corynebacterium faecigallinarum]|uniref:hypothetical protein n=1 Tax=Candidatus Corynebacterium faecigallinarum TaxID=2838528 RepID=UPI003FD11A15
MTVRLQHPPILSHLCRLNLTPSAGSTIVPFSIIVAVRIIVAAPVTSSSGRRRITPIP